MLRIYIDKKFFYYGKWCFLDIYITTLEMGKRLRILFDHYHFYKNYSLLYCLNSIYTE